MADDKVKILGESAVNFPKAISARIEKLASLNQEIKGELDKDLEDLHMTLPGVETRLEEVKNNISSFIQDAETEFKELNEVCVELREAVDNVEKSTNSTEISAQLDLLTSEVEGLDLLFQTQTGAMNNALAQLNREQEEMGILYNQKAESVTDAFQEYETECNTLKEATEEINSVTITQMTILKDECDTQMGILKEVVSKWERGADVAVDTLTDGMAKSLKTADDRVVELLSDVDSFFQEEIVEPTDQKAERLVGTINELNETVIDSNTEVKYSCERVEPRLQDIESEAKSLNDAIIGFQNFARYLIPGI